MHYTYLAHYQRPVSSSLHTEPPRVPAPQDHQHPHHPERGLGGVVKGVGRLEAGTRTHEGTRHSHFSPAAFLVAPLVTFLQTGQKEVHTMRSQPPQQPSNWAHYTKSKMVGIACTITWTRDTRRLHTPVSNHCAV